MRPSLRIRRGEALTVTLSGLTGDETALLQKIFFMSDRPDRPGFEVSKPGVFSVHGSASQLRHCLPRLIGHTQVPGRIASLFRSQLDNVLRSDYTIVAGGRVLDLGSRTHIMGILNVTPDSFSDGGQFAGHDAAVAHARTLAADGADIIDIGGESTRPGALPLTEDEELQRVLPVIERIVRDTHVPVSIDTYKAGVARRALAAGASIVNDISGLRFSPDMAPIAADHGAVVVLMHIQGTPRDMQVDPVYGDVVGEVMDYLAESAEIALKAGVGRDRILVDPGIGFGKTLQHNLEIISRLDEFLALGFPIVMGTSRKRFIGTVLDIAEPRARVEGTAATVALAIERGAHIVRVHDVGYMTKVARMTDAVVRAGAHE
ncbi:MAG: dihydropteroate synthase [Nitrospirota bacterium]